MPFNEQFLIINYQKLMQFKICTNSILDLAPAVWKSALKMFSGGWVGKTGWLGSSKGVTDILKGGGKTSLLEICFLITQ